MFYTWKVYFPFKLQYAACLTGGSFDELHMHQNIDACEWLTEALQNLEVPSIDRSYANMRSVCIIPYSLLLSC